MTYWIAYRTTTTPTQTLDRRNVSGYDFHLVSGSPAIDTGVNNSFTAVDMDDVARPYNGIYDMGAYEYHGGNTNHDRNLRPLP